VEFPESEDASSSPLFPSLERPSLPNIEPCKIEQKEVISKLYFIDAFKYDFNLGNANQERTRHYEILKKK
jgi:hypothetical protein